MLAIRDENMVNAAQAARQAQGKGHMAPKTPGARFPKTPSRLPLNDENAMGGKTALKATGTVRQSAKPRDMVTPLGTQARAPLGNKTTNAKARTGQATGGKNVLKDSDTTQAKPTTTKKVRHKGPAFEPLRIEEADTKTSDELDVEYAPPKARDLPYESDVFPDGTITFDGLKQENLMKGYYNYFHNPMGQDGVRLQDRQHEERVRKALEEHDKELLHDIETMDWSVADVPGADKLVQRKNVATTNSTISSTATVKRVPQSHGHGATSYPATIKSRRAASALSMADGSTVKAKKTPEIVPARRPLSAILPGKRTARALAIPKPSANSGAIGEAVSRSTIGYTKGRSASSLLTNRAQPHNVTSHRRAASAAAALKPDQPTQSVGAGKGDEQPLQRLEFLSIFDPEDDNGDLGGIPEFDDDLDGDFELKLV